MLLLPEDARDGEYVVSGRRARHVREVHRAKAGDTLRVGLLGGRVGRGLVRAVTADEVAFEVVLDAEPPPRSPVELLLAIPRPKALRRVLQTVAAMGVSRVVLLNAARVEKSYFDSPLLAPESVRDELLLGLEQGCDTRLPEIVLRPRFRPFVEDELELLWPTATRLLAHPGGAGLEAVARPAPPVVAAIGPEGGWVPFELELLQARGFIPFSLGPRPLRVEAAVPAIVAQVELRVSLPAALPDHTA